MTASSIGPAGLVHNLRPCFVPCSRTLPDLRHLWPFYQLRFCSTLSHFVSAFDLILQKLSACYDVSSPVHLHLLFVIDVLNKFMDKIFDKCRILGLIQILLLLILSKQNAALLSWISQSILQMQDNAIPPNLPWPPWLSRQAWPAWPWPNDHFD